MEILLKMDRTAVYINTCDISRRNGSRVACAIYCVGSGLGLVGLHEAGVRGWLPRRMIGDDLQGCGGDVFQGPNSAIAARYLVYFLKVSCELIIIRYSDDDELT